MGTSLSHWQLDSRLQADTIRVVEDDFRIILLMNDCRWPWLIQVPKIADAEELHDLDGERVLQELERTTMLANQLKSITQCEKINIASIGNIVRQLHIHIIARNPGDANWPSPVWGHGQALPYPASQSAELIEQLKDRIIAPSLP